MARLLLLLRKKIGLSSSSPVVPANALVDDGGDYLVDENGDYILDNS